MKTFEKSNGKDINLKDLFFVIKKRLWIVIAITVISSLLGVYYSSHFNKTLLYQSSSRIIIGADSDYRNTLQVIIKDPTILDIVVKQLGLQQSGESLAGNISVQSIDNTQVVSIDVTDTNPNRAALIATTVARVFKDEIPKIVNFDKVTLLSDAKVNPWPINKSQNRMVIIGLIGGLIMGIGLVFLLDSLDATLRTNRDIEELLGLPVLGNIPKINRRNIKRKKTKQAGLEIRGETVGSK